MATLTLKITDIPEHHPLATLAHEADRAAVKWPDLPGAAMSVETLRRMLYPQARVLRGPLLPDSPTATPSQGDGKPEYEDSGAWFQALKLAYRNSKPG